MTITEKEWYIEAPWGRISIVAWGHCYNPPVLLCHGVMDTVVSFRPLVQLLPNNFYYIGFDFPGSGKSDPFPPGLMMNFYDLVYCLELVVRHHRWEKFVLLGHSAGALVGMIYNFCFPHKVSKLIQLDPIAPPVEPAIFSLWYKRSYQKLFDDFEYYNGSKDTRPVYTREEALNKIMNSLGVTKEQGDSTLTRVLEDAGDGLVRFTFDQRYKIFPLPSLSSDQLKSLIIQSTAQVLVIPCEESLKQRKYSRMPFVVDGSINNNNYMVRSVDGDHNVHIRQPQRIAGVAGQFMIFGPEGLDAQAKL